MQDDIKTGIALVLLVLAIALTLVFALEYARGEGWLEPRSERSLFMDPPDADSAAPDDR